MDQYKSLVSQLGSAIDELHSCFEEIGLSSYERQEREQQVFAALSASITEQIELTNGEKNNLISECENIINEIEKLERSLSNESPKQKRRLKITCPLIQCRDSLKEKEAAIAKMHEERYGQIKKLVAAMQAYSEHLESGFIRVQLPPITNDASQVRSFNLSEPYFNKLDDEFTRVYQEYTRRVSQVQQICTEIVQLWAELGTPSIQTDQTIVQCYREEPEKLGLREEDIRRLKAKKEKLIGERENRERRIEELKENISLLWDKLSIPEHERKSFLSNHRGVGLKVITELEDEYEKLMELKHQNLHIFVEDARGQLQDLWDRLLFSEDDILAFQPAFSEVYTDALLSAHEAEISRLEKLVEERMPILSLIDRYRSLLDDKEQLAASANDASRLVSRSAGNRDPGRLLREEKLRKRIARDLPKIEAELTRALEDWEDQYGTPFLVHGENYLDVIEDNSTAPRPARTRSNTTSAMGNMGPPPVKLNLNPKTPTKSNSTTTRSTPLKTPQTINRTRSVPTMPGARPGRNNSVSSEASRPKTPIREHPGRPKTPNSGRPDYLRPKTPSVRGSGTSAGIQRPKTPGLSNSFNGRSKTPPAQQRTTTPISKTPTYGGGGSMRHPPPALTSVADNRYATLAKTRGVSPTKRPALNGTDAFEAPKLANITRPRTPGQSLTNRPNSSSSSGSNGERDSIRGSVSGSVSGSMGRSTPAPRTRPQGPQRTLPSPPVQLLESPKYEPTAPRYNAEKFNSVGPAYLKKMNEASQRQKPPRQPSTGSTASLTSGYTNATNSSENWETYDDKTDDEDEAEARETYYHRMRTVNSTIKRVSGLGEVTYGGRKDGSGARERVQSDNVQILHSDDDEWDNDFN